MKKLHPVQKKLLTILKQNWDEELTIRDLQERIGVSSTSVVTHHIFQLEKKGYLKKNPDNPRDYQILSDPERQIAYLNLYGPAHCGPNGSILDGNPVDKIPISSRLLSFHSTDAFLVKAKGDSMSPRIKEGDLVIAKKTKNIDNGKIAVCVNNGEALIKKIQRENNKGEQKTILVSLNSAYAPFLAADDFRVEGEVRGVISRKI